MGIEIKEQLRELDDAARRTSYSVIESPMGNLESHLATISVAAEGAGSRVTWAVEVSPDELLGLFLPIYEGSVVELKKRLDAGDKLFILDVREPNEYQINRIQGSTLIPLGELPRRYQELPKDVEIIAQCKSGARSGKAQDFLKSVGISNVKNLTGGILAWIDQVDPSQPKY